MFDQVARVGRWMLLGVLAIGSGAACGSEDGGLGARALVRNDFQGAKFTLVRVVYREAAWDEAIGLGQQSGEREVSPGLDHAYALAVWEYDPASDPPQVPLVIRTKNKVEAIRDARADIVFSEANHTGKCGGLPKEEYESIAARFFPGIPVQAYEDIECPGSRGP